MKAQKKAAIGVGASKVTLNLAGKSATLTMEQVRELYQKLGEFLTPTYHSYGTYIRQHFPFGGSTTCGTASAPTWATNTAPEANSSITITDEEG